MRKFGKFENSDGRYPDKLLVSKSLQRIGILNFNHSPQTYIDKYKHESMFYMILHMKQSGY